MTGLSCPDLKADGLSSMGWSRMLFPMRSGRVGRGCRALTLSHHLKGRAESAKESGPEHILSSVKFSKCELQPQMSRIPIRRGGSSESPAAQPSKGSPVGRKALSTACESPTVKVWKLLRPGLHRHLSLTGVSEKEITLQQPSTALRKGADRSCHYKEDAIIEATQEIDEKLQQVEEVPVMPLPEKMCDTVTLCGEA